MNKIFKRFTCFLSALTLSASLLTACDKKEEADFSNAPDYSTCNEKFVVYGYGSICEDWYQINGVRYYLEESLLTEDNIKLYADGNYNILYIDWVIQEHAGGASYNFEEGKLKEIMDWAHGQNMKCLVFQPDIYALSNRTASIIDPVKAATDPTNYFASEEALANWVEYLLRGLKDHPAFYGVVTIDEPDYTKFKAIGEVSRAVLKVCPDAYIMSNNLPFAADSSEHRQMYTEGGAGMRDEDAYKAYLNTYYEEVGQYTGTIQYDDYPILSGGILPTYLQCHQMVSDFAKEKNLERRMVTQTCTYSKRRRAEEADMWFQLNISMAMGVRDFAYFKYYPVINSNRVHKEEDYIVDRHGNPNPLYYTVQKCNTELQFYAKALTNFRYQGMTWETKAPMPTGAHYITAAMYKNDMKYITDYSFEVKHQTGGMVLVTEMYDAANDQYGYFVVNTTDPELTSETVVTLKIKDFKNVQIWQNSSVNNVQLSEDGEVPLHLGTGRGAFVMPF